MYSRLLAGVVALSCVAATPAAAQLQLVPYASGFDTPVGMVQDPGDPAVQYVVEQKGRISVIQNGTVLTTRFLDFGDPSSAESPIRFGGERGLLGLALPPDYAVSGRAYIYFTDKHDNGNSVIRRYKRSASNPLVLDTTSFLDLEWEPGQPFIQQPTDAGFENHKGGKILFGPDGFLYIALGDGGSGGDPGNRAQDPNTLLGKILRIDVSVPDGNAKGYGIPADNPFVDNIPIPARGEIWDFGVRNPWRITFDTPGLGGTGALLIGDVGQGQWEEVDYEPAGRGGRNYGWALREGAHPHKNATPAFTPLVDPIHEYSFGGQAITGGYVYRGGVLGAAFSGRYFFADFVQRRFFSLGLTIDPGTGEAAPVPAGQVTEHTAEVGGGDAFGGVSSIDIDSHGEIYLVSRSRNEILKLTANTDVDADTLPDAWETQFGLNPGSSAGNDGASGDPDGDGRTNAQEFAAGTHPTGVTALTRYLAEGSSSTFFETKIGLANPGTAPASVQLRFLRTGASVITHALTIDAQRHVTVRPEQLTGLQAADFSTVVETNQEVVVERTMTWTRTDRFGSHSERAVNAPSTTWYFAEGATHGAFDTFYLLANPSDTAANVEVTYLRPDGAPPLVKLHTVGANTRSTIVVDDEMPELAATDVSASIRVLNDVGIIAERAMYRTSHGVAFNAGHDSAGVTAPARNWFFAEGATGGFFDLYLLLANPGATAANVTVRYLLPGGAAPQSVPYAVGPTSRETISVEGELPALADTAVAMIVESDQPIVAERAMYWPADWIEAHNSPGATETGTAWAIAGGELGGATAVQTYVLIANTSQAEGRARVTVLRENGAPLSLELPLPPDSRTNVPMGDIGEFAGANNSRFGVLVESLGASPAQIVVERATYADGANGVVWAAGSNSLATKLR